ncbi:FecCD family ABC transporter permease [Labrys neptuniae]
MRRTRATDGKAVLRWRGGLELRLGNLYAGLFLIAATLALAALSSGIGTIGADLGDLARALVGTPLAADKAYALWDVRLPRILTGFLAGWLVAMAASMLQSLTRNPLADPGLLGLSQGSMIMIMLALIFAPATSQFLIPLAALAGGLAVALLLLVLVGRERANGLAILLMGIAIETVLSSIASLLILYTPSETSYALSSWLAGSLFQASWSGIAALMPWFLLSLPAAFLAGRRLAPYDLGDETAQALGEPIGWSRPAILLTAVLLGAAAVTAVGPLMFLGVLAPQLVGFLSPALARARLFLTGLMGGLLVVAADSLTRSLAGEMALPLGLSLTLIGVPLFILSLRLRALKLS